MRLFRQFHTDTRGAVSILVLLTIWCLVALVGMLWNTAEYATKRQNIQNAADSAAHSAATWMSRSVNLTAAQNMIIAQDGSAEVIARAVTPTYNSLMTELNREYEAALQDNTLRSRLPGLLASVDKNYALLQGAMQDIGKDLGSVKFPDQKTADAYQNKIRQAVVAINWVEGTYVNGGAPSAGNPGPPGPNGEGLRQLVNEWANNQTLTKQIQQAILASLAKQGYPTLMTPRPSTPGVLMNFQTHTSSMGALQSVVSALQQHEQKVFDTEKQIADALPDTVTQQVKQIADFYKVDAQLTTQIIPADAPPQQNNASPVDHTQVQAPVEDQAMVDGTAGLNHTDAIRAAHPELNLPTTVTIDPINPNTGIYKSDSDATLNLSLVDAGSQILYPQQQIDTGVAQVPVVNINCNPRFGGWGHSWIFPIERYFSNRVGNDMQGLQQEFFQNGSSGIDDLRVQLAQTLNQLAGISNYQNIPDPAGTINDTQNDPATGAPDSIRVLPDLTLPTTAQAPSQIRTDIDFTYTNAANSYMNAVRRLAAVLRQFGAFYNQFTVPIAVPTWDAKIDNATIIVAQELGQAETLGQAKDPDKGFMVLRSYQLVAIPDWAKSGLQSSLQTAILAQIITYNINSVGNRFLNAGVPNPWGTARAVIAGSPEIEQAATEIAAEMVSRPWPYEKKPPQIVVPPTQGMGIEDRQQYFSVLVSAITTDANAPKLVLPFFFGTPGSLSAYSQAESFNWMEYNDSYGGYATEKFDEVSGNVSSGWTPVVTGLIACPRAWRLASQGGWNWQPRLSVSDMLAPAMVQDSAFASRMSGTGITSTDAGALKIVNVH